MRTPQFAEGSVPYAELRARLEVAEETLAAIVAGEIDAIRVDTAAGGRVFTLTSAEEPYRLMVEAMSEGAGTVTTPGGVILYCNRRFAEMVKADLRTVIGSSLAAYFAAEDAAKNRYGNPRE